MWEESEDGSDEGSAGEHFGTLSSVESCDSVAPYYHLVVGCKIVSDRNKQI